MPTKTKKQTKNETHRNDAFRLRKGEKAGRKSDAEVHVFGDGIICDTDTRGHVTPGGRSPLEIVLDASEGFIPLWSNDMTLRWRFQERSFESFESPANAKNEIRQLMGEALLAWGDSAPVKFAEREDSWDFEIVMRESDRCTINGCVLASAFFPDAGRHELRLYPRMFTQDREEQVETIVHEIGHVFGLRHFFANISETQWASQIFGTHNAFSIMNYGNQSELTADDRSDLKKLYSLVWRGELTQINGTPVRLVEPFHNVGGGPPENVVAVGQIQTVVEPKARYAVGR